MKRFLLLTFITLSACTTDGELLPSSTPKVENKKMIDKAAQKGSASRYLCKGDQEIKIVRVKTTKKAKINAINLTYGGITGKLKATLSQTGKVYTNIHWHWSEKNGKGTLLNSLGQPLAEECQKQ